VAPTSSIRWRIILKGKGSHRQGKGWSSLKSPIQNLIVSPFKKDLATDTPFSQIHLAEKSKFHKKGRGLFGCRSGSASMCCGYATLVYRYNAKEM